MPSWPPQLDHAGVVDGELLSESEGLVFAFNEKYSLRAKVDIAHMRYFEIAVYHVRPGHHHEWEEAVKLVKAAYEKIPDVHWAAFQRVFGGEDESYAIIIPRKSLAEVDKGFGMGKEFAANMGEEGMKKLHELEASAIASTIVPVVSVQPARELSPGGMGKGRPGFLEAQAGQGAGGCAQEVGETCRAVSSRRVIVKAAADRRGSESKPREAENHSFLRSRPRRFWDLSEFISSARSLPARIRFLPT